MSILLAVSVSYEGFLGDPVGAAVRYRFNYDSLSLLVRGGAGIGGIFSYLNVALLGDALITVPIQKGVSVYMGGGLLTGTRLFGGLDAGIGVRVILGGDMRITDQVALGFEFAPLVVKSFVGKAHPGISFGLRGIYYPSAQRGDEESKEVVRTEEEGTRKAEARATSKRKAKKPKTVKRVTSTQEEKKSSESRTVIDHKRAEEEYKKGLQAYADGNLRKAKLHFEAALRYDPSYEKARIALEKVKRQLGER